MNQNKEKVFWDCPEEEGGLPVICSWEDGWHKKVAKLIHEKRNFIFYGNAKTIKILEKLHNFAQKAVVASIFGGIGSIFTVVERMGFKATEEEIAKGLFEASEKFFKLTKDKGEINPKVLIFSFIVSLSLIAVALIVWGIGLLYKKRKVKVEFEYYYKKGKIRVIFLAEPETSSV